MSLPEQMPFNIQFYVVEKWWQNVLWHLWFKWRGYERMRLVKVVATTRPLRAKWSVELAPDVYTDEAKDYLDSLKEEP